VKIRTEADKIIVSLTKSDWEVMQGRPARSFIHELKRAIPHDERYYNSDTKEWHIENRPEHLETIKEIHRWNF